MNKTLSASWGRWSARALCFGAVSWGGFAAAACLAGDSVAYDPSGGGTKKIPVERIKGDWVGGILPKMVEAKKPFELLNPFAPAKYGWGIDTVSWDRRSAKPKGFILFSVRAW